ncbi:hypothetical protein EMMF5_002046 [Cystobasidiomycetes sp. EMM_F5]
MLSSALALLLFSSAISAIFAAPIASDAGVQSNAQIGAVTAEQSSRNPATAGGDEQFNTNAAWTNEPPLTTAVTTLPKHGTITDTYTYNAYPSTIITSGTYTSSGRIYTYTYGLPTGKPSTLLDIRTYTY